MNKKVNLVILTGLSGAGKTSASEKLEDMGYYVIDNLPYQLFNKFLPMLSELGMKNIALTLSLNAENKDDFKEYFTAIRKNKTFNLSIFYFYASKEKLLKRYKETRRKHPFAEDGNDLSQAIDMEIEALNGCENLADYHIDTTALKAFELKDIVAQTLDISTNFKVVLQSFGFKNGIPIDADMVFDVRFLPNPFYIEELKHKTGMDSEVYDYVFSFEEAQTMATHMKRMLEFCIEQYQKEGRSEVVIAIGCTGGQHRSVSFVRFLENFLQDYDKNLTIKTKHREKGWWHG